MSCTVCNQHEGNVSGIVKGTYVSNVCRGCFDALLADQSVSSGWADYMRSREFEDHQVDVIQPYTADGSPSQDFARMYPDKARSMFGEDTFRKLS